MTFCGITATGRRLADVSSEFHSIGHVEVWGSNDVAFAGYKLAEIQTDTATGTYVVPIFADEMYRYITLRTYLDGIKLRIDSFKPLINPFPAFPPPPAVCVADGDVCQLEGNNCCSGSCTYSYWGVRICTDLLFTRRLLEQHDVHEPPPPPSVKGCMDSLSVNYDERATEDAPCTRRYARPIAGVVGPLVGCVLRATDDATTYATTDERGGVSLPMRTNSIVSVASGCPDAALGAQLRGMTAMRTTADASALTPLSTVAARVLQHHGKDYNRSAAQHQTCLALVGALDDRACLVQRVLDDAPSGGASWGPADSNEHTAPYRAWIVTQLILAKLVDIAADALVCASAELCKPRCQGCESVGKASPTEVHAAVYEAVSEAVVQGKRLDLRDPQVVSSTLQDAAQALGSEVSVDMSEAFASAAARVWQHATGVNATFESFVDMDIKAGGDTDSSRRAVSGCTDPTSGNYRSDATFDDNTCRGGRRLAERRSQTPKQQRAPPPQYYQVRALTATTCDPDTPPDAALRARLRAGVLWAALNDVESDTACHDCLRNRTNASCHEFFASKAGLDGHARETKARTRRRLLSEKESRQKLEAAVREHLSKVCCARSKSRPWEPEKCGIEYCNLHIQRKGAARMGHTLRRLQQQKHPGTQAMEPQHLVGIDLIAPHEHAIEECRHSSGNGRNPHTGPSDEECFARSLVQHVATKHGVDPQTVHEGVGKFGYTVAELVKRAHDFVGLDKDVRGDRMREPPRHDSKEKSKQREGDRLKFENRKRKLREEQAGDVGLMSAVVDPLGGVHPTTARLFTASLRPHPVGRALEGAAGMMELGNNWSVAASRFVGGLHRIAHRKRSKASSARRRRRLELGGSLQPEASTTRVRPALARIESRKAHEVLPSRASLGHMTALVTGSPNSLLSRIGQSAASAAAALQRGSRINAEILSKASSIADPWLERRRLREQDSRLNGAALKRVLDTMHARFEKKLPSGRRLREVAHAPDMPDWYTRRWGWVVGQFDWKGLASESRRLSEADNHRMHWWSEGALGEMPSKAKTGYPLMDARIPPSAVGRFMRLLAHRIQGKTPPWEEFGKGRRLDEAVAAPNPRLGRRMMESSWTDFLPHQPTATLHVAHALETRDHRTTTRKLAEAFFEGALTAPYAVASFTRTGGTYEKSTDVSTFEATLRYVVFDTALVISDLKPQT